MGTRNMQNKRIEIHSGPDDRGRYSYTLHYDTDSPPYCSTCGGTVSFGTPGLVRCVGYPSGSTESRRQGCGASGPTMHRAQGFFAPLPQKGA
jgi:hypothetical protein